MFCRDAWHNHHGLSRTEAKRRYISTLIDTMHEYATTTPEARELVSELEFVWDQIKSNSASSSGSSPGQLVGSQGHQITHPSFASIGRVGGGRVDTDRGDGGLRVLRPVSDGDEEEDDNEDEEFEEARGGADDDEAEGKAIIPNQGVQGQDLDVRNRKWRKRIEHALVKMTTEVAALREQMEAKSVSEGRRRNGMWAWMVWLVWIAVRHTLVNLAVMGVLVVWARRKRDNRMEVGLGLLAQYLGDQVRRISRPLRVPAQKQGI